MQFKGHNLQIYILLAVLFLTPPLGVAKVGKVQILPFVAFTCFSL